MQIEPVFCLWAALCLLILPLRWSVAAFIAAAIHELCHWLMILLTGGNIRGITLGARGAVMEAELTGRGAEALCALAGPLGSFFLLFFLHVYPELAVCGAVQCGFNMLPIHPLDGGRVLHCLLPENICAAVTAGCLVFLAGLCLWLAVEWKAGLLPVFAFILVLKRSQY